MAGALESCKLRVAFALNPELDSFRRPSIASELGNVCHSMVESVTKGELRVSAGSENGKKVLSEAWDQRIYEARQRLVQAWGTDSVPEPSRWYRYQYVKVPLLMFLAGRIREDTSPSPSSATISQNFSGSTSEGWLRSQDGKVRGRPDLVEHSDGAVEVVDLKSGAQYLDDDSIMRPDHRQQLLFYAFLWHEVHGEWPSLGSIQNVAGGKTSFQIDPTECIDVVAAGLENLEELNTALASRDSQENLASPSTDTCRYCPYRPGCRPFWDAINPEWDTFKKDVLGTVELSGQEDSVLNIDNIQAGNLEQGISQVRLIGMPDTPSFSINTQVSVVDSSPTAFPNDIRYEWDTMVLAWNSQD
jgi:hypothetical protein